MQLPPVHRVGMLLTCCGMKLTYFWSSDPMRMPFSTRCNERIGAVPELLRHLKAAGYNAESVDISTLTEKERNEAYVRVSLPAVYRRYELRKLLGTNRRSACWFGAEVPALLVTLGDAASDTYPHRKENRIATIHDFLTNLLATGTSREKPGRSV